MKEMRAHLGKGIGKPLGTIVIEKQGVPIENIWDTIQDFGVERCELEKINPTYTELLEVYSAIKAYRLSVKYLQKLKTCIE